MFKRLDKGSPPQVRGKRFDVTYDQKAHRITPAGAGKTMCSQSSQIQGKDHPRRCGENPPSSAHLRSGQGSPPQVRGKQTVNDSNLKYYRITPAGAGKTQSVKLWNFARRDHPRRCGENAVPQPVYTIKPGSPPQVRGKLHISPQFFQYIGITPAGAGKTIFTAETEADAEDHPRRCGENGREAGATGVMSGSPPQVRGKLLPRKSREDVIRITPAGAGKTKKKY